MRTKQWPTKAQTNYLQHSLLRMLGNPGKKLSATFGITMSEAKTGI